MKETLNDPESGLRRPVALFRGMLSDLAISRELAWRLFVRNVRAKYRQTLLGYVWVFLPPLATTLVWVFLSRQRILSVGPTEVPYPAYVLVGTLLWQVFLDALRAPLTMVGTARLMLAKLSFPRESLILAGAGEVLLNFVIRLVLLVGVFAWFRIPLHATLLVAPLGVLVLVMLGTVVGLLLVPVGMLYRDVTFGLAVVTQLWFFVTPIIYPPPVSWPASLVARLNPVSPILVTTRDWLTTGKAGDIPGFAVVSAATFVLLILGWLLYRLAMPHLIERMSA